MSPGFCIFQSLKVLSNDVVIMCCKSFLSINKGKSWHIGEILHFQTWWQEGKLFHCLRWEKGKCSQLLLSSITCTFFNFDHSAKHRHYSVRNRKLWNKLSTVMGVTGDKGGRVLSPNKVKLSFSSNLVTLHFDVDVCWSLFTTPKQVLGQKYCTIFNNYV